MEAAEAKDGDVEHKHEGVMLSANCTVWKVSVLTVEVILLCRYTELYDKYLQLFESELSGESSRHAFGTVIVEEG
jgi:hypothetical protein